MELRRWMPRLRLSPSKRRRKEPLNQTPRSPGSLVGIESSRQTQKALEFYHDRLTSLEAPSDHPGLRAIYTARSFLGVLTTLASSHLHLCSILDFFGAVTNMYAKLKHVKAQRYHGQAFEVRKGSMTSILIVLHLTGIAPWVAGLSCRLPIISNGPADLIHQSSLGTARRCHDQNGILTAVELVR